MNGTADGHSEKQGSIVESADISHLQQYDLLIIGAGIGGINVAYRFQERFPNLTYAILEARREVGGTWDLFRYPGVRSDSDLYTFGFEWRPWPERIPIVEGGKILQYLKDSIAESGIDKNIHFQSKVIESNWSSSDQAWTLAAETVENESESKHLKFYRGRFLVFASGYGFISGLVSNPPC
jgi:cation diffusion facilitator CzcD-associated flavoprotein CzcO